jgi:hypothetical protein
MALLLAAVASISVVVGGHWHHEHPARVGDRANPRDWLAHGHRRPSCARPAAVSRRSRILEVSGGIAGIVMGIAFSEGISIVTGWAAPISLGAVGGGFLFSAAVGIFFVLLPGAKGGPSRSHRRAALRVTAHPPGKTFASLDGLRALCGPVRSSFVFQSMWSGRLRTRMTSEGKCRSTRSLTSFLSKRVGSH